MVTLYSEEDAAAVTTEAAIAADEAIATEAPVEGTEAPAVITEAVDDIVEEITEGMLKRNLLNMVACPKSGQPVLRWNF